MFVVAHQTDHLHGREREVEQIASTMRRFVRAQQKPKTSTAIASILAAEHSDESEPTTKSGGGGGDDIGGVSDVGGVGGVSTFAAPSSTSPPNAPAVVPLVQPRMTGVSSGGGGIGGGGGGGGGDSQQQQQNETVVRDAEAILSFAGDAAYRGAPPLVVMLSGAGGMGKTSLVFSVMAQVLFSVIFGY